MHVIQKTHILQGLKLHVSQPWTLYTGSDNDSRFDLFRVILNKLKKTLILTFHFLVLNYNNDFGTVYKLELNTIH